MQLRLILITIGRRAFDRAVRFYEALGWRRSVRSAEGVPFFQVGGMALALWPRDKLAQDDGLPVEGESFRGFALAYNTASREKTDAVLAEAVEAGGTLVKAGRDRAWDGYTGYCAEPDGVLWEAAWNPDFTLLPDGTLKLPD